jgi:hypothetical protein
MGNSPSVDVGSHMEGDDEKCPVVHEKISTDKCPVDHANMKPEELKKYKNPHQYNVYAEKIDPNNQMPSNPNQVASSDQSIPLSKERQQSRIRKGGTDGTWSYPSEQMFWNALKRKNKSNHVSEHDIEAVIRIHNGTNERAWLNVMEWEKCFKSQCDDPTLLKFMGKPQAPSIRSWWNKTILRKNHFDRHDWIIDRCGKEVRYILDFYYEDRDVHLEKKSDGFYNTKPNVQIDARPALFDSFSNFKEYCVGFFGRSNH